MDEKELLNHPKIRAMLNVIRTAEGADYNTRVGGSKFSDLSKNIVSPLDWKNVHLMKSSKKICPPSWISV